MMPYSKTATSRTSIARALVAGVALLASHTTASAQSLAQQTRRLSAPGDGPSNVISVNPFLPLLGFFAGEYEHRITRAVSFAISGSHVKPNDTRYTNFDAKLRLYPNETALTGFNIAASLGVARIRDTGTYYDCVVPVVLGDSGCSDQTTAAFTTGSFAIEVGYQWMLGPSRVTVITVGGGAKRYIGGTDADFRYIDRVIPTLRTSIGYAFR